MTRLARSVILAGLFAGTAAAADWPQWRGPDRTGVSKETGLLKAWPKDGPKLKWKATGVGTGYSTPSVAKGVVYVQTTHGGDEGLAALDEATGKLKWDTPIGKVGPNKGPQYPGTRSTPTVDSDRVYGLASDGQLACLDLAGKVVWTKSLPKDFGGQVGNWMYSESVLIDGDALVCTPGGNDATLAKLNKKTGEVLWKAAVPGGDIADYASVMAADAGGKKVYVQYMRKALVGVDAATGKFLWKYTKTQDQGASMLTPVVVGNKVFAAGSRSGGGLVELTPDGDGVAAKELFFEKAVAPSIGGAVLIGDHLYGTAGPGLFCAEFATGKVKWKETSVGPASVCAADGRLYARVHNSGDVVLIDPSPDKFAEAGRFKQPDRSKIPAWPHPIVANGCLYLRDQDVLLCYDVAAKP